MKVEHVCDNCKCIHLVKTADLKRGWGKTCSKSCAASIKARKPNSNYKKFINNKQSSEFSNAHQFDNQSWLDKSGEY